MLAASNGHTAVVDALLTQENIDVNLKAKVFVIRGF